jgi:flagellar protein FlaG
MADVERVLSLTSVPAADPGAGAGAFARDRKPPSPDPSRYRLVIEEGPQGGSFVYKTLDRLTGEVIRQVPREEVLNLAGQSPVRGAVIDTSI